MRGQPDAGAVGAAGAGRPTTAQGLQRVLWWAVAAAAASVLGVARLLPPDPSGHGTHTQLGLPPCGFLWLTALPCPACGLTTAFAHITRLEITSAVEAHPLGLPLFALTLIAVPVSLWAGVRRWSLFDALERFQVQRVAIALAAGAAAAWVARLGAIVLD